MTKHAKAAGSTSLLAASGPGLLIAYYLRTFCYGYIDCLRARNSGGLYVEYPEPNSLPRINDSPGCLVAWNKGTG